MWMMLSPREVGAVMVKTSGIGENAVLLEAVKGRLDEITGELELDEQAITAVERAAANWQGGYEKPFKALLAAIARHR
jgi:hypothetical protein